MSVEVMKQALEALEVSTDWDVNATGKQAQSMRAITALREALAEQPAHEPDNIYAYAGVKIWVGNTQVSRFISMTAIEHEAVKGMCLHMAANWCLQELKERT